MFATNLMAVDTVEWLVRNVTQMSTLIVVMQEKSPKTPKFILLGQLMSK